MRSSEYHFYTLVELLVVVFILGSLLAFLPKLFAVSITKAEDVECRSNLKNLGLVTQLYTENNNDFLPHHDGGSSQPPYDQVWYALYDPYIEAIPKHRIKQEPSLMRLHQLENGDRGYSYKMNSRLQDYKGIKSYTSPPFRHVATIPSPHQTILLFDGDVENSVKKYRPYGMFKGVHNRHQGQAALLLGDLHVEGSSGGHETPYWKDAGGFIWDPDVTLSEQ